MPADLKTENDKTGKEQNILKSSISKAAAPRKRHVYGDTAQNITTRRGTMPNSTTTTFVS